MMKLLARIVVALTVGASAAALGGPVDDGWDDFDQYLFLTARGKWRPLAEQGNIAAISALNHMYLVQDGTRRDKVEAAEWTQRVAAQPDNWRAQIELGMLYARGQGLPRNPDLSQQWFDRAAAQGGIEAMMRLAHMHRAGDGVAKDVATAVCWYQTAAVHGHASALVDLGQMHLDGTAIVQDRVAAYMWFIIAADHLPPGEQRSEVEMLRDITSLQMTSAEIGEARRRARAWQDGFTPLAAPDHVLP